MPRRGPADASLAGALRLAVMRLSRRMRAEVEGELTWSQFSALVRIVKLGPISIGDLAAAESVQAPSMTRTVRQLVEGGYVRRDLDDDDRRVVQLRAVPRGVRAVERGRSRMSAFLASRLEHLDAADRAVLARAAELLEELAESA